MAYAYTWVGTGLPESPQKGFTETGGVLVLRTPTDQGPAKLRYRGVKPQTLNLTFLMTTAQVTILENFVKITLKGTARFGFKHPRTAVIKEVRIVPQGGGDYYTLSYVAPGYYNVTIQFEVLP
jgi:hypothetical protein